MHHKSKASFEVVQFARDRYVPYTFGYESVRRAIYQKFGFMVGVSTVRDWIYETRAYA